MKRMIAVIAACSMVVGCATIFGSSSKSVLFTSEPTNADVLINGQPYGKTPLSVKLKQKTDYVIVFRSPGHEDRTYKLGNHVGAGWIILDVLGGLIPVIIDAATGAWYSLDDESAHGVLTPAKIPATTDSVAVPSAPETR